MVAGFLLSLWMCVGCRNLDHSGQTGRKVSPVFSESRKEEGTE